MKKTNTILIAILLLLSANTAHSQITCKDDSMYVYNFVTGTMIKNLTLKQFNTYHANGLISLELALYKDSTNWRNSFKNEYTYNSAGKLTQRTSHVWSTITNSWENKYEVNFTYNLAGQNIEEISKTWVPSINDWNFVKYIYSYNAAGQQTQRLYQFWSTITSSWKDGSKTDNTYNVAGQQTQEQMQIWDTTTAAWVNNSKDDFTNNAAGQLTQKIDQHWNTTTTAWVNYSKEDNTYNAAGHITQKVRQQWNTSTTAWVNHSKEDYTYNAAGELTEQLTQFWNTTTTAWENYYKYKYTYFPNGCLQLYDYYSNWNSRNNRFDSHSQAEHFGSQPTSILETPNAVAFSISPNPATSQITISTEESTGSISITNLVGQTVLEQLILSKETRISTNNIQAGIYLVTIQQEGRSSTKKLVIE